MLADKPRADSDSDLYGSGHHIGSSSVNKQLIMLGLLKNLPHFSSMKHLLVLLPVHQ